MMRVSSQAPQSRASDPTGACAYILHMTAFEARRILVPTDFSPGCEAAVRVAGAMAERLGAKIDLLHVWSPLSMLAPDAAYIPSASDITARTAELEKKLLDAAGTLGLPADRIERNLVGGAAAWRAITEYAESHGVDLIVMATHGRKGLEHFLMGSVAERVVRTSRVPVLVVPPR